LDPCRRQPFRGRCPPGPNGLQMRSQFVLRYYLRNGECISYPYGHCVSDENEPRLFRYKEECEDACTKNGGVGKEVTYATAGPVSVETSSTTTPTTSRASTSTSTPSTSTPASTSLKTTEASKTDAPKTTEAPKTALCPGGQLPLKDAKGLLVDCSSTSCPPTFSCHSSICCQLIIQKEQLPTILEGTSTTTIKILDASPIQLPETEKSLETNICSLPKDRGSCDQYQMRFYFNKEIGECKYFFYGGCEGNSNNFARVEDCEKACLKESKGESPSSSLFTQTTTKRINTITDFKVPSSFSSRTTIPPQPFIEPDTPQLSVITFQPEIDKSQLPVFDKKQQQQIIPPLLGLNRCQHPKDNGDCAAQFVRWFWNSELRNCESFAYSGCGGNGNNLLAVMNV
jgi:hypothetical protein